MTTGFYVFARVFVGSLNIIGAVIFPHLRIVHSVNAFIAIIPTSLWIAALWVPYPGNLILQWSSFAFGLTQGNVY